jgi:hypothetical protein
MTPEIWRILELREEKAQEFWDPKRNRTASDGDHIAGFIEALDEALLILGYHQQTTTENQS